MENFSHDGSTSAAEHTPDPGSWLAFPWSDPSYPHVSCVCVHRACQRGESCRDRDTSELQLLPVLLDLGICPKILGNEPGPWDPGKWEDDLGIWAQAATNENFDIKQNKTGKNDFDRVSIFSGKVLSKNMPYFFRTNDVTKIALRRRILMSCLYLPTYSVLDHVDAGCRVNFRWL